MDGSSGFGLPTHPPSRHGMFMAVAFRVFVPFTAAGQRGRFTPLPRIHLHIVNIRFEVWQLTEAGLIVKNLLTCPLPAKVARYFFYAADSLGC